MFSFKIDFEIERGEGGEDTYIGDNTKSGMNGIWNIHTDTYMGDNAKSGMNGIWNAGGVRDMKSIEFIQFICK